MTVKELIEELKKMPENAEVEMEVPSGYEFASGSVGTVTLDKLGYVQLTC